MPSSRPPSKSIPARRPPSKPIPAPKPPSPQLVKLQSNHTRPPKPMRPPPSPPDKRSFSPFQLEQANMGARRSFRINGRSRMNVETFLQETRGSVANLITKEFSRIWIWQRCKNNCLGRGWERH